MTYPGSSSISPEVQQRIRATFEQTLGLAERGSHQEAALGCDFVLQLDPQFVPAKTLAERLRQTDGAVVVDDLRDLLAGRPSEAERKAEADALFGDKTDPGLGHFDLGDEIADLDSELPEINAATDEEMEGGDLTDRLNRLYDERRYEELGAIAGEHSERVAADAKLAHLASTAATRHEAAPYVERFVAAARRAREKGDEAEAAALLDKARSLDPSHPALGATGRPPEASPPPAAAAPVFAAARDPFAEESDPRIAELLQEGQAAFDRDDHQGAIDAWSRIFLIDIDHAEASRRIEEARRLKSEQERRLEEAYHDALTDLDAGRLDAAREGFERVLAMSPGHLAAREQLDRLASGRTTPVRPLNTAAPLASGPVPELKADPEPLKEEILVPPEPGMEAAGRPPAKGSAAGARSGLSLRFLVIGSAVLVLVLVAAYVLWQNWDGFFPNAEDAPVEQATQIDPIARAMRLHDSGRTAIAINQLRRLPPSSPQYEEAQALISQWEAAEQPGDGEEAPPPPSDADAARQQQLLADAASAAAAGENLRARGLIVEAEGLAALPPQGEALKAETEQALRPLARFVDLLAQGEQQRALPELWALHQADPDDRDVSQLIADAYYNLATRSLQQGDAATAVEHLQEVVELRPGDAETARLLRFAETYAQRDKDLLYRIYVKYLPPR